MPESIPLTPEAAAVWAAFNNGMEAGEVFACGPSEALTAALRELVQTARITRGGGIILDGHVILAIADNIEEAITYAHNQSNGN